MFEDIDVPFAEAVMMALPVASPVAVNTALVVPWAMVTDGGIWRACALSTDSAIGVSVSWAALMLTVKLPVAPTLMAKVAGASAVTATGGAATLTIAEAVVPFRLAVIPPCPRASVLTCTGTVVWPAGTTIWAGTDTIPAGLVLRATVVSVAWPAEMVSVSVALAPMVTIDVAGRRETAVGGAGFTVIWLEADEPFRLAVTCADPGDTPETGTGALNCPAGTVTMAATDAMPGALLASCTEVSAVRAAEIVTV